MAVVSRRLAFPEIDPSQEVPPEAGPSGELGGNEHRGADPAGGGGRSWLKRLVLLALAGMIAGVAGIVGVFVYYGRELPNIETLKDYRPPQTTRILAADGTVIRELFTERRTVVPPEDVPAVLVQALISAEDANFFEHGGVDYLGILKAAVSNLLPGRQTRGASTLTQQTVKTFLLSNERTMSRKIKEAILSVRLERNLSKQDILHLYLNQIFFGNNRYGVDEAARFYFGKSVQEIGLGEAAVLASIPKSPNDINPRRNLERTKDRQTYVLRRMVENGFITAAQAQAEIDRPIEVAPLPVTGPGGYYSEEVRRELTARLGAELVESGGLTIETGMDPLLQGAAEEAVRSGLRTIDKRQGWRGALGRLGNEAWERLKAQLTPDGQSIVDLRLVDTTLAEETTDETELRRIARAVRWRPMQPGREVIARVNKVVARGADVDLGSTVAWMPLSSAEWARRWNPGAWTAPPKSMAEVVKAGDLVLVRVVAVTPCSKQAKAGDCEVARVEVALEQNPKVEGALVAIDPADRTVVALVGGFDSARSPFNRATQAKRQPGSAFKPFVYAAALETGRFTPRTEVLDTPEIIRDRWTGQPWVPKNYERDSFAGAMTLRSALAQSKNTVAVKLIADIGREPGVAMSEDDAQDRGLDRLADLSRRAGIDSALPRSLTTALGSGDVSPMELVNAYTTFAANGRYARPILVRRVRAPDGSLLLENRPSFEQQPPRHLELEEGRPNRGLHADVAFVTSDLMRSVVEDPSGTARFMQRLGRPIAGKTGTTSENRDAWFVGFTPELVAGAWVGFDDHQPLGRAETGGRAAGPMWLSFMEAARDHLPPREFEMPPGVEQVEIDPRTGLLADTHSPWIETEVFLSGTEPTELTPPPDHISIEDFLRGGMGP